MPSESYCRIELLGDLRVVQPDQVLTRFRTHKAAWLLAYLALHLPQAQPRERLMELFWPEMDLDTARNNLSTILTSLRRQLESVGVPAGSILIADRQSVHLNTEVVTTDVQEFERLQKAAARAASRTERAELLDRALGLVRGEVLASCYEEWAEQARTRWSEQALRMMEQRLGLLEEEGAWEQALVLARRITESDPYREEAYRIQMRLQASLGRASSALETYQNLQRFLKENLGVLPDARTQEMMEQIRRDPAAFQVTRPAASVAGLPDKPVAPSQGTPQPVPALPTTSSSTIPTLPLQLTRFFGREAELGQLEALLCRPEVRLVTLMGPGGVGKTRLAIALGERLASAFEGRVWFVPLADLPDASLIPFALANALKLPPAQGADPLEQVVEALGERPALLLLDNFEHLLRTPLAPGKNDQPAGSEGAILVRLLLQRVPLLTCLVTSRQALRVGGEQEFPLPALALPSGSSDHTPERLLSTASVALYTNRAQAARPDFALTAHNAQAVVALCRKLEGIPLAIEIAAAWAKLIPPGRMLERLEQHLDLPASRQRDLPRRHQSLRATIAWSYDLLNPELREAFAHLSVFQGGWTLEAAEALCGSEALSMLEELQSRSLIVSEEREEGVRWRMLEVLREYGAERLAETDADAVRRLHARYFTDWVKAQEEYLFGPQMGAIIEARHAEFDNIRAALLWCQKHDGPMGLRLAGGMQRYWYNRGNRPEGMALLKAALAHPDAQAPTSDRANVLNAVGSLNMMANDWAAAQTHFEAALQIWRAVGERKGVAAILGNLGNLASRQGNVAYAWQCYEEALAINREIGNRKAEATNLMNTAILANGQKEFERARALYEETRTLCLETENPWLLTYAVFGLGQLETGQGEWATAAAYFAEALELCRETSNRSKTGNVLEGVAEALHHFGEHVLAARAYGAANQIRTLSGTPVPMHAREGREQEIHKVRAALSPEAFDAAYQEGQALTWEEAITFGIESLRGVSS